MNNYNDNNKAKGNNAVKAAFERMQESTFDLRRDGRGDIVLAVSNAAILWPNFSGKPNPKSRYKSDTRNFDIVIPEIMNLQDGTTISVSDLKANGWNVRNIPLDYEVRDDGIQVYHINVTVNMDFYKEPLVRTFNTLNGKRYTKDLHGGDVSRLDGDLRDGFVTSVDVEVKGNPRKDVKVNPGEPVPCTIYMNKLYAITEPQNTWDDNEKYRGWANTKNVTDDEIIDEAIGNQND